MDRIGGSNGSIGNVDSVNGNVNIGKELTNNEFPSAGRARNGGEEEKDAKRALLGKLKLGGDMPRVHS